MENEIMNYCIEKNYRNNDALRASFNRLAEKTFGLGEKTGPDAITECWQMGSGRPAFRLSQLRPGDAVQCAGAGHC